MKQNDVPKFNRHFCFKQILIYVHLYSSKADFLKKANFLQICIFKWFGQFYREAVNIKNISNK
jgi:hypothetical protein